MLLIHNSSVMCSWPSHIKEDSENETIANAKRSPPKENSILFTWFLRTLFLDGRGYHSCRAQPSHAHYLAEPKRYRVSAIRNERRYKLTEAREEVVAEEDLPRSASMIAIGGLKMSRASSSSSRKKSRH